MEENKLTRNNVNTVLIAIDYDPSAQKVAETGYHLAEAMNARVVVMHAITDTIGYYSRGYSSIMGFTGYANNDLWNLGSMEDLSAASVEYLDKIRTHLGDPSIETVIETGDPSDAILKVAERVNADMIVMGSHSRRGLEKILMGSVAEKVLRHTEKPMFVIPVRNQ
ncbi:MAG: universal stress protein [Bacteroidales bacterium]|jgi:nucleotide-binding universal stress UspA family protein|nr:universal stress protein [Bacteroidales bacterium]MDD2571401.1 universal stress protein [Bacteroidales bacterium]MDD3385969.1 universal stress protein [Bacteroidales bacterium]MDD3811689.1 universal stress protein [Bacteroidales bacterium]MDD3872493.1 universal stress protein [Bacteroidales bacterium]